MSEQDVNDAIRILNDWLDPRWQAVRNHASACFTQKLSIEESQAGYLEIEDQWNAFEAERDKDVIQEVAQKLIDKGRGEILLLIIRRHLHEISVDFPILFLNYVPYGMLEISGRSYSVLSWLLALRNPAYEATGINPTELAHHIALLEQHKEAHPLSLHEVRAAIRMISALPRANLSLGGDADSAKTTGLSGRKGRTRVKSNIELPYEPSAYLGEISSSGIEIKHQESAYSLVGRVPLKKILLEILATAWSAAWIEVLQESEEVGSDPPYHRPIYLELSKSRLRTLNAATASRTNFQRLRRLVKFKGDKLLFSEGKIRTSNIQFRLAKPLPEMSRMKSIETLGEVVRKNLSLL